MKISSKKSLFLTSWHSVNICIKICICVIVVCDILKIYQYHDNFSISLLYRISISMLLQKILICFENAIIIEILKNISINIHSLVCDGTIMLEMKVGSVQFRSFCTGVLGLLLVLCNSLVQKLYLIHIYKYRPPTQLIHPHN